MGNFNVLDILNINSKSMKKDFNIQMINISNIKESKSNFYVAEDIEDLANSIEMFGVQQNLIVKEIDNNMFELIAGHRRKLACLKLVEEGKEEFQQVPCIIESSNDEIREKLLLICTNSTARVLSDYEKVEQAKQLKELLIEYKKENKLSGRVRDLVADTLNISQTQVARMDSIANNLSDDFKNEFKEDKINISTAYEIAGLDKNKQEEIYERAKEKENSEKVTFDISLKDIKRIKEMEKKESVTPPERASFELIGKCIYNEGYQCSLPETSKTIKGDGTNCNDKCCWECSNQEKCKLQCHSSLNQPVKQTTSNIKDKEEKFIVQLSELEEINEDEVEEIDDDEQEEAIDPEGYNCRDIKSEIYTLMNYIDTYRKINDMSIGRRKAKMRLDAMILLDNEMKKNEI